MSSSTTETPVVRAETVAITGDMVTAELSEGRSISVPLAWNPRLSYGTLEERSNWRLIGRGSGIHREPAVVEEVAVAARLDEP
jgi:hypothetical protein